MTPAELHALLKPEPPRPAWMIRRDLPLYPSFPTQNAREIDATQNFNAEMRVINGDITGIRTKHTIKRDNKHQRVVATLVFRI